MSNDRLITIHKDENRPEMWFFRTTTEINRRGVPRCKMLPDQVIPIISPSEGAVSTNYIHVDTTANVESPHDMRKENPAETVFATTSLEHAYATNRDGTNGAMYYRAGSTIYIVTGPKQNAPAEVIVAYNQFSRTGIAPRFSRPSSAEPEPSSSRLDNLLRAYPCPTPIKDGLYVDPLTWQRLIHNFDRGHHSLLTGPDGTAKTELAQFIGKVHAGTTETIDMGAKIDPIASLIGQNKFDTKVGSYFDRAAFTYHIEQQGTIIFDEISRSHPTVNNILFPVLDSRRVLKVDIAGEALREIAVHKDCRFLATANEGYQYTGTKGLDTALRSRFKVVPIDYMPEGEEIKVLNVRTKLKHAACTTIVKVATTLRNQYKEGNLSVGASTRATLDAADMAEGGFPLHFALVLAFEPLFMAEEKKLVRDILMAL